MPFPLHSARLAAASLLVSSCLTAALAQSPGPLATRYQPSADKLIAASLADTHGYANLTFLCDQIGKRTPAPHPSPARSRGPPTP